jgi:CheY-like chemotaxis protein
MAAYNKKTILVPQKAPSSMSDIVRILMVDDDNDDHFLFTAALKRINVLKAVVISAFSGKQAQEYLSSGNYPDFIVLDLNMPVVDGYDVLKSLKSSILWQGIPVFVFTTSNRELDEFRCKSMGCLEFYTKPMTGEEYIPIIESMLHKISFSY